MCVVCETVEGEAAANVGSPHGGVAQLVERLHGMQEVSWVRSPSPPPWMSPAQRERGFFLGGLVTGEGSFIVTRGPQLADGERALRFVFSVTMASRDRPLLLGLRDAIGRGSVRDSEPQKPHWQPRSVLTINSRRAHVDATIPFMDAFLLAPTHKRVQYEQWKGALLAYEVERPRKVGRSTCSEPECTGVVRGRGLCRAHYYRATGW